MLKIPINTVFITRSLDYGGAQRQLVNLAKAMDREKFNPTVLHFYSGPLEKELIEATVRTIALEKKGRWEVLGFLLRLYRTLKSLKPDAIHGYLALPNILTILLKPLFPGTRMVFGLRGSGVDYSRYDWLTRVSDSTQDFLSRFADLIIVNSNAGYEHSINKGIPKKKMIVIPNGIDTHRFKPDLESGLTIRKEWGIREDEILIALVGRLDPMKDHPNFLKAASILAKKNDKVRFVCMGRGPESYKNRLLSMGEEMGLADRVIWVPPRSDMPLVYNAFNIVTSSSSFGEGFSNVIGEAMACKIPCVVTDVGDSPWIIGTSGVVVPPKDPEALAAGWTQCLNKKNDEKAVQARIRIENNFSLSHLARQTENALILGTT